ncbi:DUF1444 family protein [Leptospira yasudae]|nr:DUF1444 family protein [Leptospira yasudae]
MNKIRILVLLIFFVSLVTEPKSSDKVDEKGFRDLVMNVLERRFPKLRIERGDLEQTIYINKIEYNLSNLYRIYLQDVGDDEELIVLHFEKAVRMTTNHSEFGLSWEKAKKKIMPQIIRQEYAKANRIFQGRTLGNGLVVSFVLNYKDGYRYILEENKNSWMVAEEEMFRNAIENLDRVNRNVRIVEVGPGIVAVSMYDSYDAARILLPKFRERLVQRLGNDFEFALPKRDFLICWSRLLSEEVKERLLKQIDSDYRSASYPISPEIFIGAIDGIKAR